VITRGKLELPRSPELGRHASRPVGGGGEGVGPPGRAAPWSVLRYARGENPTVVTGGEAPATVIAPAAKPELM
jgi:hypothetical protein